MKRKEIVREDLDKMTEKQLSQVPEKTIRKLCGIWEYIAWLNLKKKRGGKKRNED